MGKETGHAHISVDVGEQAECDLAQEQPVYAAVSQGVGSGAGCAAGLQLSVFCPLVFLLLALLLECCIWRATEREG